ncbi:MAG: hypothetical protein WDN09_02090 [bacterium]
MSFWDRTKQRIWRFIYGFFPRIQRGLLKSGLIWHEKERQRYHLGWLAPGKTLEELKRHLNEKWGFGNHFIAWIDSGQVLSWRKLASFKHQYHLRVFEDGEMRGHYEFTPEAHPIDHFRERGEEDRSGDFMRFLGDFITTEKYISHLVMDPEAWNPGSQITFNHRQAA